jgi:hypothetical protein
MAVNINTSGLPIILRELSEVGSMKNSPPLTDAERMNRAVLFNLEI